MTEPPFLFETRGKIAILTFNRPEKMNSITPEVGRLSREAWQRFAADDSLLVAILTGAGNRAFCAGADLGQQIPAFTGAAKGQRWPRRSEQFGSTIYKPILAAVNGFCIAGGMETLLGTDIRIASSTATFGLAEARRGLAPIAGSTVRLPRQIPYCRAMEILLVGDLISAQTALEVGLINRVVEPEELMPQSLELAERIARNGPLALRIIKESVLTNLQLTTPFWIESTFGEQLFASEDAVEGPRAFMERREPNFQGR
jgi:enoyl-CoA hydratase